MWSVLFICLVFYVVMFLFLSILCHVLNVTCISDCPFLHAPSVSSSISLVCVTVTAGHEQVCDVWLYYFYVTKTTNDISGIGIADKSFAFHCFMHCWYCGIYVDFCICLDVYPFFHVCILALILGIISC